MQNNSSAARLLLLRHAHASYARPGQGDFDRNLDRRGMAECAAVAGKALDRGIAPTLAAVSPAQRCVETASLFLEAVSARPELTYDRALYDDDENHYLALAGTVMPGQTLLIVGHNPMTENAFEALAADSAKAGQWLASGYPTAGLAIFVRTAQSGWQLEETLSP